MGKIGFMLLGGAITIAGLVVLTLITVLVSQIQEKIIMHKIKKENNLSNQLAKAKEILAKLLEEEKTNMYWEMNGSDKSSYYEVRKQAEQFLKDNEEDVF